MRNIIFIFFTIFLAFGCKEKRKTSPSKHEGEVFVKVRSVPLPKGGWGFEIFSDSQIYIKQYFIPSIPGIVPFKTENDALKTGEFIVQKLKQGIALPSIDSSDLINLGVISPKKEK